MPKAILVDIDGTLANIDHRRHFICPDPNQYEYVYSLGSLDFYSDGISNKPLFIHRDTKMPFKKNWKKFNEEMVNDTPNMWCVELIYRMYPFLKLIFVSGREECFRSVTRDKLIEWLSPIGIYNYEIFMRPTGDYRPDTKIKLEIYENEIKEKYKILFAIDDRKKIVDLWRSLGITCLACAEGNF